MCKVPDQAVPVSNDASKPNAPVKPVSSSTVNRHSRGGSFTLDLASSKAKAAATPIPLSKPWLKISSCHRLWKRGHGPQRKTELSMINASISSQVIWVGS